jgi:hypothetical protein
MSFPASGKLGSYTDMEETVCLSDDHCGRSRPVTEADQ